ncbi:hypothetical protein SpCBS45565_g03259 [Spizellomyces sp. 'palustris']|nr:hypothetical protein SpCBS45565_g03259 [Spizellomyces sp. 'palustris']
MLSRLTSLWRTTPSRLTTSVTPLNTTTSSCISRLALAQQIRGSKHPSYGGKKLPGYLIPRQAEKTSHLKQKLKMKWFRLKIGKGGQRPGRPRYGRDDFILSKMNL